MDDKTKLLGEIYETSFAVNDLTLYLDTHPEDAQALAEFQAMHARRKTAMQTFEKKYYPLTVDCMSGSKDGWTWGSAPAPWQGGMTNVEL